LCVYLVNKGLRTLVLRAEEVLITWWVKEKGPVARRGGSEGLYPSLPLCRTAEK
jgi:hypothetical protein